MKIRNFYQTFTKDFRWKLQGGTYKVRNEIETKRNETKSTKTKRNETKRNQQKRNETKRNQRNVNEIKRNQRKQNEINENKSKQKMEEKIIGA